MDINREREREKEKKEKRKSNKENVYLMLSVEQSLNIYI